MVHFPVCLHLTLALLTPTYPGIELNSIHHDVYPAIDLSKSSFEGQRVFISGASKGIGRAAAVAFAKAGAAAICLGARSDLSLVEEDIQEAAIVAGKKPPMVWTVNLDVSNRQSVEAAANTVGECCKSIDVLVNNAGYHSRFETITHGDPDDWWKSWQTVRLLPISLPQLTWVFAKSTPFMRNSRPNNLISLRNSGIRHLIHRQPAMVDILHHPVV